MAESVVIGLPHTACISETDFVHKIIRAHIILLFYTRIITAANHACFLLSAFDTECNAYTVGDGQICWCMNFTGILFILYRKSVAVLWHERIQTEVRIHHGGTHELLRKTVDRGTLRNILFNCIQYTVSSCHLMSHVKSGYWSQTSWESLHWIKYLKPFQKSKNQKQKKPKIKDWIRESERESWGPSIDNTHFPDLICPSVCELCVLNKLPHISQDNTHSLRF